MYSEVRTEALARPGAPLEWQGGRTLTGLERGCCLRDLQARAVTRPAASAAPTQKMALPALTAMAAGLMIGSGIFMLPRRFGDATGVFGADRLGGRRRRHVHAGAGVPVARPAKARPRRRRLRARCGLDFDLNPIILEQSRTAAMSLPSE